MSTVTVCSVVKLQIESELSISRKWTRVPTVLRYPQHKTCSTLPRVTLTLVTPTDFRVTLKKQKLSESPSNEQRTNLGS